MRLPWVRGFDGFLLRFDGVIIARNDFFYRFNTRLTRRFWRVAVEAQVNYFFLLISATPSSFRSQL